MEGDATGRRLGQNFADGNSKLSLQQGEAYPGEEAYPAVGGAAAFLVAGALPEEVEAEERTAEDGSWFISSWF